MRSAPQRACTKRHGGTVSMPGVRKWEKANGNSPPMCGAEGGKAGRGKGRFFQRGKQSGQGTGIEAGHARKAPAHGRGEAMDSGRKVAYHKKNPDSFFPECAAQFPFPAGAPGLPHPDFGEA